MRIPSELLVEQDETRSRRLEYVRALADRETALVIGGGRPDLREGESFHLLCDARPPGAPDLAITTFVSFGHDEAGFDVMAAKRRMPAASGELIRTLARPAAHLPMGGGKRLYEPQRFRALGASADLVSVADPMEPDLMIPDSGTKFGGIPYDFNGKNQRTFDQLGDRGFRLFLQLDFPARTDLDGSWIFADGMFWLFHRVRDDGSEWVHLWDF